MGMDASAVARGVGIATSYKDFSAGKAKFCPQRIAVVAQGQTGVVYSTTKFSPASLAEVGATLGYSSLAYMMCRELFPAVGSIPVDVYPLADGGTAAAGDVDATGTTVSANSEFYAVIGGVRTASWTVLKGTLDVNYAVEQVRQAINGKLGIPVTAAHAYGTVTSAPGTNTGNGTLGTVTGSGAYKAGNWKLTCVATATNAGTFKLVDPDGLTVSSAVTVAVAYNGGSGGLSFTIADGTTDFAVGDSFTITAAVTKLNLTSAWKGASANAIKVSIVGPSTTGVTWTVTQPTGGATDPTVDAALAQVGESWPTIVLNGLLASNSTALDAFQTWGEARYGVLVHKPSAVLYGNTEPDVATAISATSLRTTDRINIQVSAPGSNNLPQVVAAAHAAKIAPIANNNPPHDYGSQLLSTINVGTDAQAWSYSQRDYAVKGGSSTVEMRYGKFVISDVVTAYKPIGEEPPAYRYLVDIVKLQNVIYNIDLEFKSDKWDGKPLIPDGQATTNPEARTPNMAKAAAAAIVDGLGLAAIISDPKTAKQNITSVINGQNPKRLDLVIPVQLSGNVGIVSVDLQFGFYFG